MLVLELYTKPQPLSLEVSALGVLVTLLCPLAFPLLLLGAACWLGRPGETELAVFDWDNRSLTIDGWARPIALTEILAISHRRSWLYEGEVGVLHLKEGRPLRFCADLCSPERLAGLCGIPLQE